MLEGKDDNEMLEVTFTRVEGWTVLVVVSIETSTEIAVAVVVVVIVTVAVGRLYLGVDTLKPILNPMLSPMLSSALEAMLDTMLEEADERAELTCDCAAQALRVLSRPYTHWHVAEHSPPGAPFCAAPSSHCSPFCGATTPSPQPTGVTPRATIYGTPLAPPAKA